MMWYPVHIEKENDKVIEEVHTTEGDHAKEEVKEEMEDEEDEVKGHGGEESGGVMALGFEIVEIQGLED